MKKTPVIAVFDIGKTHKKLLCFDPNYQVVWSRTATLPETLDEDDFPCEDIRALTNWILERFRELLSVPELQVQAVNASAYGASWVFLDKNREIVAPLYNYLKPFPSALQAHFFAQYGDPSALSRQTASPLLGSLNSGLQLYRRRHEAPELFARIRYALHLPQFILLLLSGRLCTDRTSIGCHTMLWDFERQGYAAWVEQENLTRLFPPLESAESAFLTHFDDHTFLIGAGLHDSSAALIPYLLAEEEPFILLSTGTWNIALNPFNKLPLRQEELEQDCLCYLRADGSPVKAARLFAGHAHEQAVGQMADYFGTDRAFYQKIAFRPELIPADNPPFRAADYPDAERAYHAFMAALVEQQVQQIEYVRTEDTRRLFVDGGFSQNALFMRLLANAYPYLEVSAAAVGQASALGAALVLHRHWNDQPLPNHLLNRIRYNPIG
jgi:sugar (pentulose or hexulose) kinase